MKDCLKLNRYETMISFYPSSGSEIMFRQQSTPGTCLLFSSSNKVILEGAFIKI